MKFSTAFPKKHPKGGQPTYFVEKILNSCKIDYRHEDYIYLLKQINIPEKHELVKRFYDGLNHDITDEKIHTIRVISTLPKPIHYSFKPEIWTGVPYRSKPIYFMPIIYGFTQRISIYPSYEIYVSNNFFGAFGSENISMLAKNDGLSHDDFRDWFLPSIKKKAFSGQIIHWKGEIY
jgi:hypothetical protein